MRVEVSLRYAQKAAEAIRDDNYLRKMLVEQTSTNVFEFNEGEDDEVDNLIDALCSRFEEVVPIEEYEVILDDYEPGFFK